MAEIDENDVENYNLKLSANELLAFQRDLKEEKELLQKMLAKIDDQVHRLQVEQLHLLGIMNKSLKGARDNVSPHKSTNDDQLESTNKSLDLSVASALKYFDEEIEDEDDA
ncbi:uncharacterized protein LOC143425289 [Xylocopa sonorina]|uniref:uncharacterized protein LOC143425289 n=1 Tax=Xylocopa sonorina TaxID=1818115 RepID=UPI00403AD31C